MTSLGQIALHVLDAPTWWRRSQVAVARKSYSPKRWCRDAEFPNDHDTMHIAP